MKYSLLVLLILFSYVFQAQIVSQNIHVDQFGYTAEGEKVAVFSNPQVGYNAAMNYTPNSTIEVVNAQTNQVVFLGQIQQWNAGATHNQSGDQGWWFDFSALQTVGEYYLVDISNNLKSYNFSITDAIYNPILEATGRMFYYNRCGMAKEVPYAEANWVDGMNFVQDQDCKYIFDPNNSSLEKDLSGGWFDAGDYNKYVNYTLGTIHNLLWAYQENPEVFSDNWNIPESGNGTPDLIDEIKWELDWLLKMVNTDGTVHIKVGSANFSENEASPPSVNNDPRYYGPTCSSAEISAASMLAHAALVFQDFTGLETYALGMETKAELVWNQVVVKLNSNSLDTECDDVSITSSDSDVAVDEQRSNALAAAIYLFALTQNNTYHQYILDNSNDSAPLGLFAWDNYHLGDIDALLLYTTLPNNNPTLSSTITTNFSNEINNNWNQYFGWTNDDLYRAFMPDWTYHWGSNSPKAAFGVLNNLIVNYDVNSSLDFEKRANETIHYFHGINPQNICYLSNMYAYGGDNCVNEIYHTWFNDGTVWDNATTDLGPAPGFMAGGPNQGYEANTSLSPPYNQPMQKSYLDFNDGWPNSSWEITEPAIYYNAIYLRLLASMAEPEAGGVTLNLKAFLEGPYDSVSNEMNDNLRQNGEIPLEEPFTELGFTHVNGGNETMEQAVLDVTGNNAITDWIFVELRNAINSTEVVATQSALIQKDGDIVSTDGVSPLVFSGINNTAVYVVLRHRNHLGIRTENAYNTTDIVAVDFTNPTTEIFGINPMNSIDGIFVLIAADANNDGQINPIDKNLFWRLENGEIFDYLNSKADFNMDGIVNPVDKNLYWRVNNSKVEQLD